MVNRMDESHLFSVLSSHSSDIVIVLDQDGKLIRMNHNAEHCLLWRLDEVRDQDFITLCRMRGIQCAITDIASVKQPQHKVEIVVNKGSGKSVFSCDVIPVYSLEAPTVKTHTIFHGSDITELVRLREEVKVSRSHLFNIINNIPHFIFWKDCDLNFLGCNENFARAAGFNSAHDVVGLTDYDFPWSAEQSDAFRFDDKTIISSGVAKLNYEEEQTQLDKSVKTMLVSKVPMVDEHRNIIGVMGIYSDISERKHNEEELKLAKKIAEQASIVKTEFIRNMQHDIRTPFSGVYGCASLLLRKETNTEKRMQLQDIFNCSKELLDYCNNVFAVSKLNSSQDPVVSKRFNVNKLALSLVSIQKPAATNKGIIVNYAIDESVPLVLLGDEERMRRILVNLMSNAIKFTQQGFVKLKIGLATPAQPSDEKRVLLKFSVIDSGIGIPEDKQKYIYEEFARIEPSYKGLHRGQGLGLYIVNQLVNQMNGEIQLTSQLGEGSTFHVFTEFRMPLTLE